MQTRRHSLIEAVANVAVGYSINVVANLAVLPLFGLVVGVRDAAGIGLVFTAISMARSYALRRAFNGLHARRPSPRPACAHEQPRRPISIPSHPTLGD